jgi:hypothetical protein
MGQATYSRWQGEAGPAGAWLNPALLPGTMAIQGNDQPCYCTKDKTYGGDICSMGVALVLPPPLPSGHIQVGTLRLPGRDLPSRGKFVHALPTMHPPEDQIIHLELPASHEPLVVVPELLPVACIFNSSLPSSLIEQVDILTPELVLCGFVICLDT